MSEEIAAADHLLAENAQLRAQLAALRDGINQYVRASPAERGPLYHRLFALTIAECPGAALLSEPAAARAVVAAARDWMEAVETLDGVYAAEQALIAVLKARDSTLLKR